MDVTDSIQFARLLLLGFVLFACSATDLYKRRIPNVILVPVLISALFIGTLAGGMPGLLDSIGGLVIGICMLLPLHVIGRMGAGDVKLMGVVGSILGVWGAVVAGLATMMAGAILALAYVTWIAVQPGFYERVSTFLKASAGTRRPAAAQAARAAEIPYAIAIAAGTCAALLYLNLLSGVIYA